MVYRNFGKMQFKPSALGFGCMRLPCKDGGNSGPKVDEAEAIRMIRSAVDNGVNYVDTAYPYHGGISEVVLGKALQDGYRSKVMLADKSPIFYISKESDFDTFLDTQLKRLGEEHIDFYLLHSLSKNTYENVVLKFDIINKAEKAKKAGKIGHIGFSFHDGNEAFNTILNGYEGWEFCQIQLNYMDVDKQAELKGLISAAKKGLGVVIMEPLMGGKLAEPPQKVREIFAKNEISQTPVQWALDFLWDMPEVSLILSGMSNRIQVEQNLRYASESKPGKLTQTDKNMFADVKKQFEQMISIPCTGCGYCMPCPQGVSIPSNFTAFNELKIYENPAIAKGTYKGMLTWQGPKSGADSCVGCRKCEQNCPQHIPIASHMPKIAEYFVKQQEGNA